MRILFDKNVPVGVRGFLRKHEVRTIVEMQWPDQLDNGELDNGQLDNGELDDLELGQLS